MTDILILIFFQLFGLVIIYFILSWKIKKALMHTALVEKVRQELSSLIVEINKTTDQNIRIIENRISILNELLLKADKKISLIKREMEKIKISTKVYNQIKNNTKLQNQHDKGNKKEHGIKELTLQEKVFNLHQQGYTPPMIASELDVTIGEVELIISLKKGK